MLSRPLTLACCAVLAFGAQAPKQKILPYPYTQEDLPNGLRLVTVPTDYPNLVALYIVVQVGSRNEVEPGHSGFAHLFEHMMGRGTERFPAEKYDDTLQRMGAASNAFTTDDFTCYNTLFSKDDLDSVMAMEADRVQNLKYSEPVFQTESLAVLGEYNKNSSNPSSKLNEVLRDTAFTQSTYRHTPMGFLKDIQAMPQYYEYSLKFFDHYYRPEYTTILLVGDVKQKAARQIADKYWGRWKRGSYKPEIPMEAPQDGPRVNHIEWRGPSLPIVTIAFKGPAYTDTAPDTAALGALAALGFSPDSELYQRVVIRERNAESLEASAPERVDPSLFQITARVRTAGDVNTVQNAILDTVRGFREKPVDEKRLETVKRHLRYSVALRMDASDSIANRLAYFIALRRTPDAMNRLYDRYARLTPAEVQQAAGRYLVETSRAIVTLMSTGGAE
jgi:zinc protease